MVDSRYRRLWLVSMAALLVGACGGGDDGDGGKGAISIAIGEPVAPLVPGDTTEAYGSQVVESLWTGLVQYDATGQVEFTGTAQSVTSPDNRTWTVELAEGWTFHDGTPVTAESFVRAWNWTAYSPNAQRGSGFFANVVGYEDLQAPTDDEGELVGDPSATEMSGLRVVDDRTFTVTLSEPFAQFPLTLGYNPFFPLPEVFYDDPAGSGSRPVGNGPFRADGEFEPDTGITVVRYEDYAGEPAAAEALEYRVYTELSSAYTAALSGDLDVLPYVPSSQAGEAEEDFGDRYLESPSSDFTYLGLPLYDDRFADPRVRQALSMGIDRAAIAEAVFDGTRRPADSVVAPVVDGHREGACGFCVLDVARANALLDEAGFDRGIPITLWFNAGADNDVWMEAVGNQLRDNLGLTFELRGDLAPPQYGPLVQSREMTGPFRMGWAMDYPSPQNFLEPLYTSGGGDNYTGYANPAFDQLVAAANAAPSSEEAVVLYNRAEDLVLQDMPVIPMFFEVGQSVHSEAVAGVVVDVFGRVETRALTPAP